jgi:hypothetical protein
VRERRGGGGASVWGVTDQSPDDGTADPGPRRLPVRRAPRYGAFLVTGAVVGVVIAVVSGLSGPSDPSVGRGALVGYLAMALGLLGGLVGGAVAVVLDRVRR